MTKLLDQFGQPLDATVLDTPQTSRVAALQNEYLAPALGGLTPARLAATLRDADQGQLLAQHRLFADMEERDAHLRAEMDKRRGAVAALPWAIVPPRDATAAEQADAEWVTQVLQDAMDPLEDVLLALMDAVGHGFSAVELVWQRAGRELLPRFEPRPHEWFTLDPSRTRVQLRDHSAWGQPLAAFGWLMHTPGKAKTGYGARLGLYRTLVWPFIYKAYALADFAEFLETFGLPIIVGKYFSGASADEKASLLRAVTALGHDARAIMPADMQLEIQKVQSGGSGESAHLAMVSYCEKAESKCILGQTLTTDAAPKGGGGYALGKIHDNVRRDILRADARSLAATLTRDLVYPLLALNRGLAGGMHRCPVWQFDFDETENLTAYADALPKLLAAGMKIDRQWAQKRLGIPEPEGDDLLVAARPEPVVMKADRPQATAQAALTAAGVVNAEAVNAPPDPHNPHDPHDPQLAQLAPAADATVAQLLETWHTIMATASSLEELLAMVEAAWPVLPVADLAATLAEGFMAAELAGRYEVSRGD